MITSQKAKEVAKASAAAFAAAAGPWADRAGLLEAEELVQACTPGADLLVMRAPLRTAALFAEELRAAARHVGLPESLLLPLGSGMWVLRQPVANDGDDRAANAHAALVSTLPMLAGVRLHLRLEASAVCGGALLEAVGASPPIRKHTRWSLHYEQHFPAGDHAQLPFVALCLAPSLAIGLHATLGDGFCSALDSDGAAQGASEGTSGTASSGAIDEYVLLETKHAVLLCRLLPLPRPPPPEADARGASSPSAPFAPSAIDEPLLPNSSGAAAPSRVDADTAAADAAVFAGHKRQRDRMREGAGTREGSARAMQNAAVGEGAGELESEAADAVPRRVSDGAKSALPWWVGAWERRGFDFSASLDPLVAIAAVNLAAFAHVAARHTTGEGSGATTTKEHGGDGARDLLGAATLAKDLSPSSALLRSLAVYDPCCGSGTVLAAATALGHRVRGSDLRAEFVRRAANNLSDVGFASAEAMDVLDATEMVAPPPGAPPPADLVVSNPPWGKNFGGAEDGAKIVDAVLRAHLGAGRTTLCLLVNAVALAAAIATPGVALRAHVRLGGVEVVVLQTDDGAVPPPTS